MVFHVFPPYCNGDSQWHHLLHSWGESPRYLAGGRGWTPDGPARSLELGRAALGDSVDGAMSKIGDVYLDTSTSTSIYIYIYWCRCWCISWCISECISEWLQCDVTGMMLPGHCWLQSDAKFGDRCVDAAPALSCESSRYNDVNGVNLIIIVIWLSLSLLSLML